MASRSSPICCENRVHASHAIRCTRSRSRSPADSSRSIRLTSTRCASLQVSIPQRFGMVVLGQAWLG